MTLLQNKSKSSTASRTKRTHHHAVVRGHDFVQPAVPGIEAALRHVTRTIAVLVAQPRVRTPLHCHECDPNVCNCFKMSSRKLPCCNNRLWWRTMPTSCCRRCALRPCPDSPRRQSHMPTCCMQDRSTGDQRHKQQCRLIHDTININNDSRPCRRSSWTGSPPHSSAQATQETPGG